MLFYETFIGIHTNIVEISKLTFTRHPVDDMWRLWRCWLWSWRYSRLSGCHIGHTSCTTRSPAGVTRIAGSCCSVDSLCTPTAPSIRSFTMPCQPSFAAPSAPSCPAAAAAAVSTFTRWQSPLPQGRFVHRSKPGYDNLGRRNAHRSLYNLLNPICF